MEQGDISRRYMESTTNNMSYGLDKFEKGERLAADKLNKYRTQILRNVGFEEGFATPKGSTPNDAKRIIRSSQGKDGEYPFQVISDPNDATKVAVRGGIWDIITNGTLAYEDPAGINGDFDTITDGGGSEVVTGEGSIQADLYTSSGSQFGGNGEYYIFLASKSSTQDGDIVNYNEYNIYISPDGERPKVSGGGTYDDYNPQSIKVLARVITDDDGKPTIYPEYKGGNLKTQAEMPDSADELAPVASPADWQMSTEGYNARGAREIYDARYVLTNNSPISGSTATQDHDKMSLYFDVDDSGGTVGTRYAWAVTAYEDTVEEAQRPFNDYDTTQGYSYAEPQVTSITDAGASGSYATLDYSYRDFTVANATLAIGEEQTGLSGVSVNISVENVDSEDITITDPFNHAELDGVNGIQDGSWAVGTFAGGSLSNDEHNDAYWQCVAQNQQETQDFLTTGYCRADLIGLEAGGLVDATNQWQSSGFVATVTNTATIIATNEVTFQSATLDVDIDAGRDILLTADDSILHNSVFHSFQTGYVTILDDTAAADGDGCLELTGGMYAGRGVYVERGGTTYAGEFYSDTNKYARLAGDGSAALLSNGSYVTNICDSVSAYALNATNSVQAVTLCNSTRAIFAAGDIEISGTTGDYYHDGNQGYTGTVQVVVDGNTKDMTISGGIITDVS